MKWFKHMADAHHDERLAALRDEGGFEAYGFYWWLLEVVAKQVGEAASASVEYPANHWRRISGFSAKKFYNMAELCSRVGLVSVETHGKLIKIECANLLKIRDNHTKNLQAKNKSKEVEEEDTVVATARAREADPPDKNFYRELQKIINAPIPLDMSRVRVWMKNGATEDLIRETVQRLMAKRQGAPPVTMKYFEMAVSEAITNQNRPMEKSDDNTNTYRNEPRSTLAAGLARFAAEG